MDREKVIREEQKCPICKEGIITVITKSEYYSYHSARAFNKVKRIPVHHPEKIEIENKCPNCGASKQDIKDALEHGKQIPHEEKLKRSKKAGMPTVIETTIEKKDDKWDEDD